MQAPARKTAAAAVAAASSSSSLAATSAPIAPTSAAATATPALRPVSALSSLLGQAVDLDFLPLLPAASKPISLTKPATPKADVSSSIHASHNNTALSHTPPTAPVADSADIAAQPLATGPRPKPAAAWSSMLGVSAVNAAAATTTTNPASAVPRATDPQKTVSRSITAGVQTRSAIQSTTDHCESLPDSAWDPMAPLSFEIPNEALLPIFLQGSRALSDVVQKFTCTTTVKITISRQARSVAFMIRGGSLPEERLAMKRKIVSTVSPKTKIKFGIPENLLGHVLGSKGCVVQAIQARTSTKIDLIRNPSPNEIVDPTEQLSQGSLEEPSVDVFVEGDTEGVRMARAQILEIVRERLPKITLKLTKDDITPEFYPFLRDLSAGVVGLENIMKRYGVAITFPSWLEQVSSQSSCVISIFGDRPSVSAASSALIDLLSTVTSTVTQFYVDITVSKHRFLISSTGDINSDCDVLIDLFNRANCVLMFSPQSAKPNMIIAYAPKDKVTDAFGMILHRAESVVLLTVDLLPFMGTNDDGFSNSVFCSWLLNSNRLEIVKQLETKFQVQICDDLSAPGNLEISGTSIPAVQQAKNEFVEFLSTKGPFFCKTITIPFELRELQPVVETLDRISSSLEESVTFDCFYPPSSSASDSAALIYMDPNALMAQPLVAAPILRQQGLPRNLILQQQQQQQQQQQNSQAFAMRGNLGQNANYSMTNAGCAVPDNTRAKAVFLKVVKELDVSVKAAVDFLCEKVHMPVEQQAYFVADNHAFAKRIVEKIHNSQIPLSIVFSTDPFLPDGRQYPIEAEKVVLRGIRHEVITLMQQVTEIIKSMQKAKTQPSVTLKIFVPQCYAAQVLGRRDGNITKFRDVIGLQSVNVLPLQPGQKPTNEDLCVVVTGIESAAEKVADSIKTSVAALVDIITKTIDIPADFHRRIIGDRGARVRALELKHNVRIHFPRSSSTQGGADNGKKMTEVVEVRGPTKCVHAGIKDLKTLLDEERAISFKEKVVVPAVIVPSLIGKGGTRISQLKTETLTRIEIPPQSENSSKQVEVVIVGSKSNAQLVKRVIQDTVAAMLALGAAWDTENVHVPKKFQRRILGADGESIRKIGMMSTPAVVAKEQPSSDTANANAKKNSTSTDPVADKKAEPKNQEGSKKSAGGEGGGVDLEKQAHRLILSIYNIDMAKKSAFSAYQVDIRNAKADQPEYLEIRAAKKELLEKVKCAIAEKIELLEDEVRLVMHLPLSFRSTLVNRGGNMINGLQDRHNVVIQFKSSVNPDEKVVPAMATFNEPVGSVYVTGPSAKAKAAMDELILLAPVSLEIEVPLLLKRGIMGKKSQNMKMLRTNFGVQVNLPFQTFYGENSFIAENYGTEIWKLHGSSQKVGLGRAELERLISEAFIEATSQRPCVHRIEDIPRDQFPAIVGPMGINATEIAESSGCHINFNPELNLIEIYGYNNDCVNNAEEAIRASVATTD